MDFLKKHSPLFWFLLALIMTAGLAAIGPQEKTLGENVRVVYLHGAWVLTAELFLALASLSGLVGLLMRSDRWHAWSQALGTDWRDLLDLVLAAFPLGHASELEWIVFG